MQNLSMIPEIPLRKLVGTGRFSDVQIAVQFPE